MKAQIDAACRCEDYDGSERGKLRRDFVACARTKIREAVKTASLRRQCSQTVQQIYTVSSCGFPPASSPEKARVPCIRQIARTGRVSCTIRPIGRCLDSPRGTFTVEPCADFDFCLDAADDNGNFLFVRDLTGGDDELCSGNVRVPVCGNAFLDAVAGEECDDANTLSGDGCSATCRNEVAASLPIESGGE